MGYPKARAAPHHQSLRFGQAVATQKLGEPRAVKCGTILEPCQEPGHWASGWVGGLQILPGVEHRWIALLNASPTAPDLGKAAAWTEEPRQVWAASRGVMKSGRSKVGTFTRSRSSGLRTCRRRPLPTAKVLTYCGISCTFCPTGRPAIFYNSGAYGPRAALPENRRLSAGPAFGIRRERNRALFPGLSYVIVSDAGNGFPHPLWRGCSCSGETFWALVLGFGLLGSAAGGGPARKHDAAFRPRQPAVGGSRHVSRRGELLLFPMPPRPRPVVPIKRARTLSRRSPSCSPPPTSCWNSSERALDFPGLAIRARGGGGRVRSHWHHVGRWWR